MGFTQDKGSLDALQFLMTREITHMKAFMAALDSLGMGPLEIGKLPPTKGLVDQFFNDSTGEGDDGAKDMTGPWNSGGAWERVDAPAFQDLANPKAGTRKSHAGDNDDSDAHRSSKKKVAPAA
jgi:Mn-containing catalase